MPRKKGQPAKPAVEHTSLAVQVEQYEAEFEAGIHHYAYSPEYAWNLDEDDPLYEFTSRLIISGLFTYPEDRAGDKFELTLRGDDAPSRRLHLQLKDIQARNEYGSPQYRQYRGKQIPVFQPPNGLGLLDKVRGERRWTAYLFVNTRFVGETFALLNHQKPIYVGIHERKIDRRRWVQSVSVQTMDPAEE